MRFKKIEDLYSIQNTDFIEICFKTEAKSLKRDLLPALQMYSNLVPLHLSTY